MKKITATFNSLVDWVCSTKRATFSLAILRIVIGIVCLAYYVSDYATRRQLFFPSGMTSEGLLTSNLEARRVWSIYSLLSTDTEFDVFYHLGIIASICVIFGIGGKITFIINFVLIWSIFWVNPYLIDGGDNLLMIVSVFLLLTNCFNRFAILNPLTKWEKKDNPALNAVHNLGVILIGIQVCLVYTMAGLYKVQGGLWQDGTALYYILRTQEFYLPGVTDILFSSDLMLVLMAYLTVLTAVYFPVLIIFKQSRLFAVSTMAIFHAGIAVFMGLTSFALIMIACDLIFVNNHVVRLYARIRCWRASKKTPHHPALEKQVA